MSQRHMLVHTHTHPEALWVTNKAGTSHWLWKWTRKPGCVPGHTAWARGLALWSWDPEAEAWSFTMGRRDLSDLNFSTMKWWNRAILNQPGSASGSFKAMLGDRRGLAKKYSRQSPNTSHASQFLPARSQSHLASVCVGRYLGNLAHWPKTPKF